MTALTRPIRRLIGRPARDPGACRGPGDARPSRPSSRASPWTSRRRTRCSPTSRPRRARSTSRGSSSRRRRSSSCAPPASSLVVPLVTQGELIGTLNLGPRLSEQDYSTDDRRLLATLAAQAAPAIRVAQLVREQAAEAAERERFEQELKVAQLIQQQFLPRELPNLPEWQVAAYYGPARVVGGDFYDFIDLGEGRIGRRRRRRDRQGRAGGARHGPHALDPARRGAAARGARARSSPAPTSCWRRRCRRGCSSPASTASWSPRPAASCSRTRATTCPTSAPSEGVIELRATGMPLGLMPGITYEETEGFVGQGDAMLLYSDGMVEQHGPGREMYGFPRLREAMATDDAGSALLDRLLDELHAFTGPGMEQEDDITLVTLRRAVGRRRRSPGPSGRACRSRATTRVPRRSPDDAQPLLAFSIEGAIGNERAAMNRVAEAVAPLGLEPARLERLKTAVAETVMNAIEYGSQGDPAVPVDVRVDADDATIRVRVTDRALSGPVPDAEMPDLDAKLEGTQKPRGWGLFLIRHMVDGMDVHAADGLQTVTLTLARTPQGGVA